MQVVRVMDGPKRIEVGGKRAVQFVELILFSDILSAIIGFYSIV